MPKTKKDILNALLQQAGYFWYNDNEDAVSKIKTENFDPAVEKIFGANAVELEKLYHEIHKSQQRVIDGLARTLVPSSALLPFPSVTVAQLNTKYARIELSPEDTFIISEADDTGKKNDFYFTPLFPHQFPQTTLKYIITNSQAIDTQTQNLITAQNPPHQFPSTKHIWIALDINKNIEPNDQITLFLGNKITNEFDPDYSVFSTTQGKHKTTWHINGNPQHPLNIQKGLQHFLQTQNNPKNQHTTTNLLNALNIPHAYEREILNRFKNSFLTIQQLPQNLNQLKQNLPPELQQYQYQTTHKQPLLWIKINFQLPIPNTFFQQNQLQVNTIPILNRKLNTRNVQKSDYDRILLPMPTKDHFLAINKIWDETSPESYQPIDLLNHQNQHGKYTIRSGQAIRRFNTHDASQQIYHLLNIIQEEQAAFKEGGVNRLKEDFNVIDKALNRIKQELNQEYYQKGLKTTHFATAHFRKKALAIYYNYWETQGDTPNQTLKHKTQLKLRSQDHRGLKGHTIIPLEPGRGNLQETDYITLLKESLLSGNKIITKGDIQLYLQKYQPQITLQKIEKQLAINQDTQNYERIILITLQLNQYHQRPQEVKDYMTSQLQNELNTKTTFFTPIKIKFT